MHFIQSEAQICRLQTWCGTFVKDEVTTLANKESNAKEHISFVNIPAKCPRTSWKPNEYRALGCKQGEWVGLFIGLGLGLIQS